MLKLKLQYLGHLRWRANSLEKTMMVGKIEGRRRGNRAWDGWMASPVQWTWVWANSGRQWRTGKLGMLQSMQWQRVGHNWVTELTDWLMVRELYLKLKENKTKKQVEKQENISPRFICGACCSVTILCLTICDPLNCSMPGFPVLHYLPELAQTHVHWVTDAIQPSHHLLLPSLFLSLSQHQGLFQWVSSSHQVAKILELQLQHHSFQWIFRVDFL